MEVENRVLECQNFVQCREERPVGGRDNLRLEREAIPRTAITLAPVGKRKRGRSMERWRRTVEKELKDLGLESWGEAFIIVRDRDNDAFVFRESWVNKQSKSNITRKPCVLFHCVRPHAILPV